MKELYAIDKSTLDAIGNAIRTKKGTAEPIPVTSLASEIASIESGSVGILLQAGKYKMIDYQYGSFAWGRQDLRGMFMSNYYETERPFTYVENDGEFCVNFVDEVDVVSSEITPSDSSNSTIKVILKEAQFISEAFSTWFNACFEKVEDEGGGNVIKAGTYKMVEFHYGVESPGLFDWGSQELNGKITWEESGATNNSNDPFTSIENDGEWCIYFKNNGANTTPPISPSFDINAWRIMIVVDDDTNVSENFKAWFDMCFFRSINARW